MILLYIPFAPLLSIRNRAGMVICAGIMVKEVLARSSKDSGNVVLSSGLLRLEPNTADKHKDNNGTLDNGELQVHVD